MDIYEISELILQKMRQLEDIYSEGEINNNTQLSLLLANNQLLQLQIKILLEILRAEGA